MAKDSSSLVRPWKREGLNIRPRLFLIDRVSNWSRSPLTSAYCYRCPSLYCLARVFQNVPATHKHYGVFQPPPQALRFSHCRGERETRVTGDKPQGTMGRVQTPSRVHFHRKRDVWVRSRAFLIFLPIFNVFSNLKTWGSHLAMSADDRFLPQGTCSRSLPPTKEKLYKLFEIFFSFPVKL